MVCAFLYILSIKGYIYRFGQDGHAAGYSIIMVSIMTLMLVNPFSFLYKEFRINLLYVLYQNIISPFGIVGFKEFFIGDILTSMVKPLIDFYVVGCFFLTDAWIEP